MKYVLYIIFSLPGLVALAQDKDDCRHNKPSSVRARETTEKLNNLITETSDLNTKITTCLVGNVSSQEFGKYAQRLSEAEDVLRQLQEVDEECTCLSSDDPRETDYYIKAAYGKLTALSIVAKRADFLDYLRVVNNLNVAEYNAAINETSPGKAYSDKLNKWALTEEKYKRETKTLIRKTTEINPNSIDAAIIKVVLSYYENSLTIEKDFEALLKRLHSRNDKFKNEKLFGSDKYLGVINSWLAYIKIGKRNYTEALSQLDTIKILSEPEKSITWAEQATLAIISKLTSGSEVSPITYNLPDGKKYFTRYTLKYEKEYANQKIRPGFKLKDEEVLIENNTPQALITTLNDKWDALTVLEDEPWKLADAALNNGTVKPLTKPVGYYARLISINKKKQLKAQCLLYRDHFDKGHQLVQDFSCLRKEWTALVAANPTDPYYKIMRMKTDLALYYFGQHQKMYTDFLKYYTLKPKATAKKHTLDRTSRETIIQQFSENVEPELAQDLDACTKADKSNVLGTIAKVEYSQYVEDTKKATQSIAGYKKSQVNGFNYNGTSLKGIAEVALAYVLLKDENMAELKRQFDNLADYTSLENATKNLKFYRKYKEDEKYYRVHSKYIKDR